MAEAAFEVNKENCLIKLTGPSTQVMLHYWETKNVKKVNRIRSSVSATQFDHAEANKLLLL